MARSTQAPEVRPRRALAVLAVVGLLVGCADGAEVDDAASSAAALASEVASSVGEDAESVDAVGTALATGLEEEGLTTLSSAVEQVDVAALAGSDEFTLFAPNDGAFLSLTADELADLVADPDLLDATLRAHLVAEAIPAASLVEMTEVTTVAGTSLPITVDGDTVTVGGATVVGTDLAVGAGLVHTIDALLGAG